MLIDILNRDSVSDSRHDLGGDLIPRLVGEGAAHVYDFTENVVPGETDRDRHYWRDVGTLDAYYEAQMDLVAPHPIFNLYNDQWPIYTAASTNPPAKLVVDGHHGPSSIENSILSNGVIVSGATVRNSVLSPGVRVDAGAVVDGCVLMDRVHIGPGARLSKVIVDKNVSVPAGEVLGGDRATDVMRFEVSDGGVVVVPKSYSFETASTVHRPVAQHDGHER